MEFSCRCVACYLLQQVGVRDDTGELVYQEDSVVSSANFEAFRSIFEFDVVADRFKEVSRCKV